VLSWFLLRGRARCCGRAFSFRYPAIELLTAALFVACWLVFPPAKALAGTFDRFAHVLDSSVDRAHLLEHPLGRSCYGKGQRGLAGAGWAPEDRARETVLLDQTAQRLSRADEVVLADNVVEGPWP